MTGVNKLKPVVLSLCDLTGNMVRPWADAGYECWIIDSQHPPGEHTKGNITRVGTDIRGWLPPRRDYCMVFAFPPCTHLSVSGARWFRRKGLGALSEALDIFATCLRICEWSGAPWFVENPVSTVSTYYRKPDHTFHPCDYGDSYTKQTCLWSGHGFRLPPKSPVPPTEGSKMHLLGPSPDRAALRSATPKGFAQAVFKEFSP